MIITSCFLLESDSPDSPQPASSDQQGQRTSRSRLEDFDKTVGSRDRQPDLLYIYRWESLNISKGGRFLKEEGSIGGVT